jgi:hypothetical protein
VVITTCIFCDQQVIKTTITVKMKKVLFIIGALAIAWLYIASCGKPLIFSEAESPVPPELKESTAKLLWIGPDYKVAVSIKVNDNQAISTVRLKNGEWQIDSVYNGASQAALVITDTFKVAKDANPTKHTVEVTVTNSKGGVIKANIPVEDLSGTNQIVGYNPDLAPPAVTVAKPTVTKFYGLNSDPVNVEVDATITDQNIASIEIKVWGETSDGQPVTHAEVITPTVPADKLSYRYTKSFSLPAGKPGEYQYIVKATDASGNKTVKGNVITVGFMDRLYLSDAETADEVTNQGYDHFGACRGIGTLMSMKPQGANVFVTDMYYRNDGTDNIRFVAFIGSDRPFNSNQSQVLYSFTGPNVVAASASDPTKITTDLAQAGFNLPVTQKGYYKVTVNMTTRSITVLPITPSKPFTDAIKYPGWSAAAPWDYLAVTGPVVIGSAGGYLEAGTSPRLMREAAHSNLYSGTFKTNGNSANISLNAPWAFVSDNGYGKGWIRLPAARTAMRDDYNDLIDKMGAVGASGGGANYGFSVSNGAATSGTFKATYDLGLDRLRIVRTGN